MPPTVNPNKNWQENTTISSATISGAPEIAYQSPNYSPVYPVAGLNTQDPAAMLQETQPEREANDLTTRLQGLNQRLVGESQYRTQQEAAQGIPQLNQSITDLSSRLTGLKNEALAIPQQLQIDATGRGTTSRGLRPIETAALRNNAIQALGVSTLLETARGNLSTAMANADRAVSERFAPIREEINATTANLELIMKSPAYSLADKRRAAQQAQVQEDRRRTLDQQEESFKTAQAMAAAAVKNNPNNPAASIAAQQALAIEPSDPQYLQKLFMLLGDFQTDPIATKSALVELQMNQEQLRQAPIAFATEQALRRAQTNAANASADASRASAAKIRAESSGGAGGNVAAGNPFVFQPNYARLTAKQRTQADSLNNLVRSLAEYKEAVNKYSGVGGANLFGTDSALLQTKVNSIIFAAAQAEGTGALQQADREVIEQMIPNATSVGGALTSWTKGGKAGQIMKIDDQISKYTANLQTYGLNPVTSTPTNTAPTDGQTHVWNGNTYKVINGQWVKQ